MLHVSQHNIHAQEYDGKQDIYDIFKCKIITLNKMFKNAIQMTASDGHEL